MLRIEAILYCITIISSRHIHAPYRGYFVLLVYQGMSSCVVYVCYTMYAFSFRAFTNHFRQVLLKQGEGVAGLKQEVMSLGKEALEVRSTVYFKDRMGLEWLNSIAEFFTK